MLSAFRGWAGAVTAGWACSSSRPIRCIGTIDTPICAATDLVAVLREDPVGSGRHASDPSASCPDSVWAELPGSAGQRCQPADPQPESTYLYPQSATDVGRLHQDGGAYRVGSAHLTATPCWDRDRGEIIGRLRLSRPGPGQRRHRSRLIRGQPDRARTRLRRRRLRRPLSGSARRTERHCARAIAWSSPPGR